MKIVINRGITPYGLSEAAYEFMRLDWEKQVIWPLERAGAGSSKKIIPMGMAYYNDRTNPKLVACIEALGKAAGVEGTDLYIAEIPDGALWWITIPEINGTEILTYTELRGDDKKK